MSCNLTKSVANSLRGTIAIVLFSSFPRVPPITHSASKYLKSTRLPVDIVTPQLLQTSNALKCLRQKIRSVASGPGIHFMEKLLLPWTYPYYETLVVLDSDIVLKGDIRALVRLVKKPIALVREQASIYQHWFKSPSFNGGVQVINTSYLHSSESYINLLQSVTSGELGRIGWHGDQTAYSLMYKKEGSFFQILPCSWNRQAGSIDMDTVHKFPTDKNAYACNRCDLLHLNGHSKLVEHLRKNTSCEHWIATAKSETRFVKHLLRSCCDVP